MARPVCSVIKVFFKCKFMELLMPAQVSIDTTKKVIPWFWLRKVSSIKKLNNLALWQERSYPSSIIEVHANKPPTKINKRASNPSLAYKKTEAQSLLERKCMIKEDNSDSDATIATMYKKSKRSSPQYLSDFTSGQPKFFTIKFDVLVYRLHFTNCAH